jgi:DNA invertase Pin-like site-specific DNA recombinase
MNNNNGKTVGYIRVSSIDQNEVRQLDGIELDKVFVDKASGKDNNRPQLQLMLDYVRDGDVVIVHSLDRIGRNLIHIKTLIEQITSKGVEVRFIKESLVFHPSQEKNPMNELMLNMLGSFAQFERDMIRERQREGIAIAKAKGIYKGRKKTLAGEQVEKIKTMIKNGISKNKIAKEFGISIPTIYRYIKRV